MGLFGSTGRTVDVFFVVRGWSLLSTRFAGPNLKDVDTEFDETIFDGNVAFLVVDC